MTSFRHPLLFLFFLWAAQLALVALYLSLENTVHFWDYAMYARMAQEWFALDGLGLKWAVFWDSFQNNYNLLFAAPSLLSFSLFGSSRTVFILTNFVFYAIPAQLALGLIVRKILDIPGSLGLFYGALIGAAVPAFWIPLLQGYPDHAAAACFLFAFLLALDGITDWRRGAKIGVFLALAVIFRRHFAYPGLALGVTLFLLSMRTLWPLSLEKTKKLFVYFAALGASGLALLALVEPHYLSAMLTVDFTALYNAYKREPFDYLFYLLSRLGVAYTLFPFLGYVFLWAALDGKYLKENPACGLLAAKPDVRFYVDFVALFFFIWFCFWFLGPAQFGDHYLVAVLPLFCATGLAGVRYLAFTHKQRKALVFLFFAAAFVFFSTFWPAEKHPLPSDPPTFSHLPTPRPPWRRRDLPNLRALAETIAKTTTEQDRVMIAASSFVLNQDLIRAVYTDLLGDFTTPQRFIPIPEIDGPEAQRAPDIFASANIYLVPSRHEFHLLETGQGVVSSLWFAANNEAFQKDPRMFLLQDVVGVWVIRRSPWMGATLHKALSVFRGAGPWVVARGAPWGVFRNRSNERFFFEGTLSAAAPEITLSHNEPLTPGRYRIGATFMRSLSCKAFSVRLRVEDSKGAALFEKSGAPLQTPGLHFWSFDVGPTAAPSFVFLSFASETKGSCPFAVSSLVFEKEPL